MCYHEEMDQENTRRRPRGREGGRAGRIPAFGAFALSFAVLLVLTVLPEPVLAECKARAEALQNEGAPKNRLAGAVLVMLWLLGAGWLALVMYRWLAPMLIGG